ncbi:MAG TPA: hypothetical protein PKH77_26755 [Anaerolineae bacterium]|nr:hypothetical protein [Anaerolineae bacterium]
MGLLRLGILTLLTLPLYYLLFLGLYSALRQTNEAYATLAVLLGCVGLTLVLATPSALSFVALSDRFAAATTASQQAHFLAAGEAMLASDLWHGSGARSGGAALAERLDIGVGGDVGESQLWPVHHLHQPRGARGGFGAHPIGILFLHAGPPLDGDCRAALPGVVFPLLARDLFRLSNDSAQE